MARLAGPRRACLARGLRCRDCIRSAGPGVPNPDPDPGPSDDLPSDTRDRDAQADAADRHQARARLRVRRTDPARAVQPPQRLRSRAELGFLGGSLRWDARTHR